MEVMNQKLALEFLTSEDSTDRCAELLHSCFKVNKHLFRKEIDMGSVLKKQWSGEGYLAERAVRPMVRPYGQFVQAPLAGDGDRPDGYMLLTASTSFWAEGELTYVSVVGCLHATDAKGQVDEEDDKFLVIPYKESLSLAEAYVLVQQIRLVLAYLVSYKSFYREGEGYCTPLKVTGFSFRTP